MKLRNSGLSLLAGILLGLLCLAIAAVITFIIPAAKPNFRFVTPVVTRIAAPPVIFPTSIPPTPAVVATTSEGIPPDPGDNLQLGMDVRITGTGGDGLRLRREAGKSAEPVFLGAENEIFTIKDGPQQADGFTWWYLSAPFDTNRAGWAVSNYLAPVVNNP